MKFRKIGTIFILYGCIMLSACGTQTIIETEHSEAIALREAKEVESADISKTKEPGSSETEGPDPVKTKEPKPSETEAPEPAKPSKTKEPKPLDLSEYDNPFFFKRGRKRAIYKGTFDIMSMSYFFEIPVTCLITDLGPYEDGNLYNLTIETEGAELGEYLEDMHKYVSERLDLGDFYVDADQIYKFNQLDNFSGAFAHDEVGHIVCLNEDMEDILEEEEEGFHHYITVSGNQSESHYYNTAVETGYFEIITWEKGVGLVHYSSGFGALRDLICLEIINEE